MTRHLLALLAILAVLLPAGSIAGRPAATPTTQTRAQVAAERVGPGLRRDLGKLGLSFGDPIYVRIFKHERELEVWVRKQERYALFRRYPICAYSGTLGPKLRQGDRQAPEGFYSVARGQLKASSQYHLAFNLGYPNAYDRAHGRTGDYLMVHGNCVSVGCYAMGDDQIEEIYTMVDAALKGGQDRVPVHVFPFRFALPPRTDWQGQAWGPFWSGLRPAYDAFEKTRLLPMVTVVGGEYRITNNAATGNVAASGSVQSQ